MTWIMWYKLKGLDGGATKADGEASAAVVPSVAMPLDNIGQNMSTIYDPSNYKIESMNSEDLLAELQIQRKFQ